MKERKRLIPELRFPEFSGEWEEKKLGEVTSLITKGTTPKRFETKGISYIKIECFEEGKINKEKCLFIAPEIHEKELKRSILQENDILFAIAGATIGKCNVVKKDLLPANTNQALSIIRLKNKKSNLFVYNILKSTKMKRYINLNLSVGAQPNLNLEQLNKFKLNFPSIEEQEKIANFLISVDSKIEFLEKKKEGLERYKKGMMEKIFKQEIRFKDERGEEYPEWEEKKLGEIGATYSGLTGKKGNDFGKGKPYIQYKQIFDKAAIDILKCGLVEIKEGENQNEVKYGDIFFTVSSETPKEIGYSSVMLEKEKEIFLNSFCFGYRPNKLKELAPVFSKYLFRSSGVRNKIIKLAQGSTRYNMSKFQFIKISINLPVLKEQKKIGDFLSSLDKKIEDTEKEIEGFKEFKKGLLQKMFV